MENLIKAITAEIEKAYKITAADLVQQPGEHEARAYRILNRGWNAKPYAGTPAQVEKKIRAALAKKKAARLAEELGKIAAAAAAPASLPRPVIISVDWTRSRTWGRTARGRDNYGNYSDVASGCGYCKESTATAGVLNYHLPILRRLYLAKDLALAKNKAIETRDAIAYGAGHGIIPYFEGGVGVRCHEEILTRLGYSVTRGDGVLVIAEK